MGLGTGMRRGELMNATWRDVDFVNMTVDVSPKRDREDMWEWHIKDTERRTLPLTAEVVKLLVEHQMSQPEGNPYIVVPMARYERIQADSLIAIASRLGVGEGSRVADIGTGGGRETFAPRRPRKWLLGE